MKVRAKARLAALTGALALAATTMVSGASPAAAADGFSFAFTHFDGSDDAVITVTNTSWSEAAGYAEWWSDPHDGNPGDALTARDRLPDGYGIEAHLSTGRVATTRGKDSPSDDTVTGNLPEGNTYTMWVCAVKGDFEKCSAKYGVRA